MAADSCPELLWVYNPGRDCWVFLSAAVEALSGYSPAAARGLSLEQVLSPGSYRFYREKHEQRLELFLEDETALRVDCDELEIVCRDGSTTRCAVTSRYTRDGRGEPVLAGVARRINAGSGASELLPVSGDHYRDILDTIEEGYYECDLRGNIVFFNAACCRICGYDEDEFRGISYKQLYKDPKLVYRRFNQVYRTGKVDSGFTAEMIRLDGQTIFAEISITPIRGPGGAISGFRGIVRDTTERVNFLRQLEYFSMHDQLTGLYNRTYLEEELRRLSKGRDYPITMISADLNGLKLINDTLGHEQGDRLLKAAAEVMQQSLRGSDVLARMGGDEFAAVLVNTGEKAAEKVVARIRGNVETLNRQCKDLYLSLSLGAATAESNAVPFSELFRRADDQMYRDKFSPSKGMRNKIVKSLLEALAQRDYIAEGHGRRLASFCGKMAEQIGLTRRQKADLALLAQVHDLGKVAIPDKILFKEGPLDSREWEIVRQHPEKGHRIALSSQSLSGVAGLILKHHERWDGDGYPLGLRGREIPLECRILAVADAYDNMTSNRPYRKARPAEEALEELERCAGSQFDPEIVRLFTGMVRDA